MTNQGSAALGRILFALGIGLFLSSGSAIAENNKFVNTYLALGDSVAFGLDVRLLTSVPPPKPSQFAGYPEIIGQVAQLPAANLIDAACPGETSASFIAPVTDLTPPDYGCNSVGPQGQPPFKGWIGLHAQYPGITQLQFATSQLSTHHNIDLVTLGIGSNDVLLLLAKCSNGADVACVNNGLTPVLNQVGQNLAQILGAIRSHYSGKLVLVTYYSPAPALNQIAIALNGVITTVGANFHAKFADGYAAFQIASAPVGGDACRAGLLVPLGPGVCDIHPTRLGSAVLAAAVVAAH
jgi:lysophospholipase L1-like esterase